MVSIKYKATFTDIPQRIARLNSEVALGEDILVTHRIDGYWRPKVLEWRPSTGKRNVDKPPTDDDCRWKLLGLSCMES